tara:strand:- start:31 stop:279 length:249 start_codon:yes stop_codon:yes gene_type:complete
MKKEYDFWLIDSNSVGVIRFYKKNENKEDLIKSMFIEEGIVMGSHGENPPLMKTRREMKIEDARLFWKNLINEGWQKTNPKW